MTFVDVCFLIFLAVALVVMFRIGYMQGVKDICKDLMDSDTIRLERIVEDGTDAVSYKVHPGNKSVYIRRDRKTEKEVGKS